MVVGRRMNRRPCCSTRWAWATPSEWRHSNTTTTIDHLPAVLLREGTQGLGVGA
jgi:hypothetical protein